MFVRLNEKVNNFCSFSFSWEFHSMHTAQSIAYYFIIHTHTHFETLNGSTPTWYTSRTLCSSVIAFYSPLIPNKWFESRISFAKTIKAKVIDFNELHLQDAFYVAPNVQLSGWFSAGTIRMCERATNKNQCLPQLCRVNDPTATARRTRWNLDLRQQPKCNCHHSEMCSTQKGEKEKVQRNYLYCRSLKCDQYVHVVRTSWEKATAVTPPINSPIPKTYNVCNESELQILTCACDLRSLPARCPDATNSRDGWMSMLCEWKIKCSRKGFESQVANGNR